MSRLDRDALTAAFGAGRKIAVLIAGSSVLAIGVLLLFLPGPAFIVIPAGLAILGLEFAWARRWLLQVREHGDRAIRAWSADRNPRN